MKMEIEKKKWLKLLLAVFFGILLLVGIVLAVSVGSGKKVVFTTGFGQDEVFRIGSVSCTKPEVMVYLTNVQNRYEEVYGKEVWTISKDGVTLEDNVRETVLARLAQVKTMYLLALEKEVSLEESEQALVRRAAEEYYQSLSERETELLGVKQDTIQTLYEEYALANKVYEYIIRDVKFSNSTRQPCVFLLDKLPEDVLVETVQIEFALDESESGCTLTEIILCAQE